MGQTVLLTGMVLNAAPAGEYDRRITLLTREQGKVTAFVRGARRPKSSLQAATNLFSFGKFEAFEGRETYTVVKAEIENYFTALYSDPERSYYGCYFLELADYFSQPYCEASDQLKLLYQTVRALTNEHLEARLVRRVYELKTLSYQGFAPNVSSCAVCGSENDLRFFSARRHGVVCGACHGASDPAIGDAALYTLRFILSSPLEKLYTFQVTDAVYGEVRACVAPYLEQYVDRPLKTRAFLPD